MQQTDNSHYKKGLVETNSAEQSFPIGPQESDLNNDGAHDPGDLPPALWVAMVFKKHGEEQYAREIIEREYREGPR